MKRFLLLLCLLVSSLLSYSQLNGVGYYRVRNNQTKYYMYVTDNTGSINISATDADMGAIQLYAGEEMAITNPATVVYFSPVNKQSASEYVCNFAAQGADVYSMINYMVHVYSRGATYEVYAESNGLAKYLDDENEPVIEDESVPSYLGYYHTVGTTKSSKLLRAWEILPINANTSNYVAVKPSFTIGGKYYAPYYAAYAFTVPEGMKVHVVTKIDAEQKVAVYSTIPAGTIIPAATPVLIECSSTDITRNKIVLEAPTKGTKPAANLLKGNYFCNDFRPKSKDAHRLYDASTMRVFGATKDGKIGFINSTKNLHVDDYIAAGWKKPDGKYYLNANSSYLPVPAGTPDELTLVSEEEYNAMSAKPGDINGDGKITANDLMLLLNHTLGTSILTGNALRAADLNGDGKINANDLMLLVNKLL